MSPLRPPERQKSAQVAAVRKGDVAYYHWLFSNLMVNVYDGLMDTNVVLPLAADRCRVIFDFYFATGTNPGKARSIDVAHTVQIEDQEICEEVQPGLSSSSYDTGRFSVEREAGVLQFHCLVCRKLTDALT